MAVLSLPEKWLPDCDTISVAWIVSRDDGRLRAADFDPDFPSEVMFW
jgi:hypothetical protein